MAFYTYLWLREDGRPYYVGKGCDDRAFTWHKRIGRAPSRDRIIIQEHLSEEDAFTAEAFLIAFYGRKDLGSGCLINLTDGGEGPAGQKMSPEWCERNRQKAKKSRPPLKPEHIAKMKAKLTGRKMSASFCEKNRARMLANNPFKGRTHSEETRRRLVEQGKLRAQTPEFKEMMRLAGEKGRATRWEKR